MAKKNDYLKLLVMKYRCRTNQPKWSELLNKDKILWRNSLKNAKAGKKILVATSLGSYLPGTMLESLLAVALTLRGAEVHVLLCDAFLPACLTCSTHHYSNHKKFSAKGPGNLCSDCFEPAYKMYASLGLTVHRYRTYVSDEELRWSEKISKSVPYDEIPLYEHDGMAVGEHAMAGALRFFARGALNGEPYGEPILRRYFKSALIATLATTNLLASNTFDSAIFHHGIYVPQGLIGEVCRKKGVRVVNWNPAYRKQCFIFSHHDTYHHELLTEATDLWESLIWNPKLEKITLDYLKSRWYGTQDWIYFHQKPQEELSAIAAELGVDFSKPCIGMLSNVIWDAQLHYRANAFPNMLDWVERTIQYFAQRPDLQLIIRIHPAEIRGNIPSRQLLADEIRKTFPTLPTNVFVIPPESQISTYAAMMQCNAVIIYGTKTGVELTSLGMPVIVAGEAWIRNKGLTLDANSSEEYFKILDQLPFNSKMSEEMVKRALKYAFHFFFRIMIPLPFMVHQPGQSLPYRFEIKGLADLQLGQNRGLDVICDGILEGNKLFYPFENIQ